MPITSSPNLFNKQIYITTHGVVFLLWRFISGTSLAYPCIFVIADTGFPFYNWSLLRRKAGRKGGGRGEGGGGGEAKGKYE